MGEKTAIAWTDHTFNPWWGCEKVSPGCTNCYADAFSHRLGYEGKRLPQLWGPDSKRRLFGERHWRDPLSWEKQAIHDGRRHRVFCASMADVFEGRPELAGERAKLWELIEVTPHLDWQLLTKRPENILGMLPGRWLAEPRDNIWLGTTCEDQDQLEQRAPRLLEVPAVVHFLSCEPLLEDIHLWRLPGDQSPDWVIVGGESGPHARLFEETWAEDLLDECLLNGIPFFMKQMGSRWARERLAHGPRRLHPHGADPSEWRRALRVQEFPTPITVGAVHEQRVEASFT